MNDAHPLRVLGWPAFRNRRWDPHQWLLYTHLQQLGAVVEEFTPARGIRWRSDVLHLHWAPTTHPRGPLVRAVARCIALISLLDWVRRRGTRVVWTAHNLNARDRVPNPILERWWWRALAPRLDGMISMSRNAIDEVHATYPSLRAVPVFIVPLGHYRTAYPRTVSRAEARARLGIASDARVVGFIGQIRTYKNVPALVSAFRGIADPSAVLLIAGKMRLPDGGEEFRRAAASDARVRLEPRFLADDEIQIYLAAVDLVVLPYAQVLNSGSAMLALSFDRPVMAPRLGSLAELADQVGPVWMRTYDGELTADTLEKALAATVRIPRPATAPLEQFDWQRIAALTLQVYHAVLHAGSPRRGGFPLSVR